MAGRGKVETVEILDAPHEGRKATPLTLVPEKRLRLNLNGPRQVCNEIARIYREGKSGTRPLDDCNKMVWQLSQLSKAMETAILEDRIKALESERTING